MLEGGNPAFRGNLPDLSGVFLFRNRALPLQANLSPRERGGLNDVQALCGHARGLFDSNAAPRNVIDRTIMICCYLTMGGPARRFPEPGEKSLKARHSETPAIVTRQDDFLTAKKSDSQIGNPGGVPDFAPGCMTSIFYGGG